MKQRLFLVLAAALVALGLNAQTDTYLKTLTEGVLQIRASKASGSVLNAAVASWGSADSPKLTLMDNAQSADANASEFSGSGAHKFQMNKVVTLVYSQQNTAMVSKGDYFNSTEKDIFYSAVEKNIKRRQTASYTLTGHIGPQEFVILSFNPKTTFTTKVNGQVAATSGEGVQTISLPAVKSTDVITITIANQSGRDESFVILNHNPQK